MATTAKVRSVFFGDPLNSHYLVTPTCIVSVDENARTTVETWDEEADVLVYVTREGVRADEVERVIARLEKKANRQPRHAKRKTASVTVPSSEDVSEIFPNASTEHVRCEAPIYLNGSSRRA